MAKRHVNRSGDLESLFLRLEELVLANSGEDEFEEVFKLIVAKLWDERCGRTARIFTALPDPRNTYFAISSLLQEAGRAWPGILENVGEPALTPEHLQVCVESAFSSHRISGIEPPSARQLFRVHGGSRRKGCERPVFYPSACCRVVCPHVETNPRGDGRGPRLRFWGLFGPCVLNYVRSNHRLSQSTSQDIRFFEFCGDLTWTRARCASPEP